MGLIRRKNRRKKSLRLRLSQALSSFLTAAHLTLRVVLAVGLVVSLPVAIYFGYQALMRSNYFVITAIQLEGNQRLQRDQMLEITGLDQPRNIFTVDTERLERQLEANPWVVSATVERELPRTLRIAVVEKERAGWLYFGDLYQVDTDGSVIDGGPATAIDGPLVTGIDPVFPAEDGGIQASRVRTALNLAHLYRVHGLDRFDELAEIHYDELLGFSLLTRDNAIEIRMGDGQFVQRLDRLRAVLETLNEENLEGRYILLDSEDSLARVAVGPVRPGRGGTGPGGMMSSHRSDVRD